MISQEVMHTRNCTIALLINPVTFEMGIGSMYFGYQIEVDEIAGSQHIATGEIDDKDIAAKLTAYPRVHSSPGLSRSYKGTKGWGTTLYCCGASAAALRHGGVIPMPQNADGSQAGVSSVPGTRDPPAERWWERAVNQHKIAIRLDIDGNTVDVMPFSLIRRRLVVALPTRQSPAGSFFDGNPSDTFGIVNTDLLSVANTGYLAHQPDGHEAMKRLVVLAKDGRMPSDKMASMIDRYNAAADEVVGYVKGSLIEREGHGVRSNPSPSRATRKLIDNLRRDRKNMGFGELAGIG